MSDKILLLIGFSTGFFTCWIGDYINAVCYEKHVFGRRLKKGETAYCGEDGIWHFEYINKRRSENVK